MPKGIKGFQKGHRHFNGAEKGWFSKGIIPVGGVQTRFKKGHIYLILEQNNIKTMDEARICKELWSLDNGVTLCVSCHKKTETYAINPKTLVNG